jgi:hypothetical protein
VSTNQDFRNRIKTPKPNFYLCDFHVHSPASVDVRVGGRFLALSNTEQDLIRKIPEKLIGKALEYEEQQLSN